MVIWWWVEELYNWHMVWHSFIFDINCRFLSYQYIYHVICSWPSNHHLQYNLSIAILPVTSCIRVISKARDGEIPPKLKLSPKILEKVGAGKMVYNTVKPVCNDHLYDKIYYLWFIQWCVLVMTEGTILLVLTTSAFWSSSRWPSRRQRSIPLGGRYRQVSLYLYWIPPISRQYPLLFLRYWFPP